MEGGESRGSPGFRVNVSTSKGVEGMIAGDSPTLNKVKPNEELALLWPLIGEGCPHEDSNRNHTSK